MLPYVLMLQTWLLFKIDADIWYIFGLASDWLAIVLPVSHKPCFKIAVGKK